MIILLKLITAHLLGDFLLQPKSWVADKEKNKVLSLKLYLHVLLHGVLILILLWDLNYWLLTLLVMVFHACIDILKLYAQTNYNKIKWFLTDQAFHFLSIILLWIFWFKPNIHFNFWTDYPPFWIYITALLFITIPTGIIIQILMYNWSRSLNDNKDGSLNQAGKYIGILERLFVFTFVVSANWQAIGFLIAAKSVFRFGDLKESKDRKLTEYILIGTLLSFGIAMAVGMLVNYLV